MTGDIFQYSEEGSNFAKKNGYIVNGIWLPRVTSILEIVAKPGLLRYYAQHKNFMAAQESLVKAASRGKKIHDACENILLNKKNLKFDDDIKETMDKFREWVEKKNIEVIEIETRVFDREKYFFAGTMDILAKVDNELGIIDIKTGSSIYNGYSLQTAAYLNAYNQGRKQQLQAQKRWILRLDQYEKCVHCGAKSREREGEKRITGGKKYCKHEFQPKSADLEFKEQKNFAHDFEAFLHAKELWEWENKGSLRRINNYPKNFSL